MNGERIVNKKKLLNYSAFLSILVVLIHAENLGIYSVSPEQSVLAKLVFYFERLISGDIAKIGVPSFFMLSGILFYRDFNLKKYPQKMKKRFFTLIIPYLLWNLFRFTIFYLLGKIHVVDEVLHINRVVFTPENFLEGVFLYKYNLGYWFMYQLILYTLLCPLIYTLLRKKSTAIASLLAVFLLFCTDALGDVSVSVFHKKFIQIDGLFYYMLGGFIGMHYFDAVNNAEKRTKHFAILGALLGQAFFVLFQITHALVFHILFCTVSAISCWYLFDSVVTKPLPKKLTTITFFIYSAHGTVLEFFQAADQLIFPNTPVTALCEYILLPTATLLILVAVAMLLKRYMRNLWKLVNGSR